MAWTKSARAPSGAGIHVTKKKSSAAGARSYPGQLRIIGGIWRSRRLTVPFSEGLRPTPDRVRETLFNWLQPYLSGASCLDLFAGTGALCLEALSRGAGRAVMVEGAARVAAALRANVARLKADGVTVIHSDASTFLADDRPRRQEIPTSFDIIFIDPPFRSDLIARCVELVYSRNWLSPEGLVYVEAPQLVEKLPLPPEWKIIRSKKAGRVGYHLAQNCG